jgi:hypothetical protein
MDWDSTEDGGTTFESAQMTRDELILLVIDNVDTIYTANSQLTGHRIVDGQTLYDLDFLDIDSFEVNANDISLASVSNTAIGVGGHLDLFATDGVGINLTAPPTAALDIEVPVGSFTPLSLYENRGGGATLGDNYSMQFYFNDSNGVRQIGADIVARVSSAPTPGDVKNDLTINKDFKVGDNGRVLITPNAVNVGAQSQFYVLGDGTSATGGIWVKSGGNTSSHIPLRAQNSDNLDILRLDGTGKFSHNLGKLATGDFRMDGGTTDNVFYFNAGTERLGIGAGVNPLEKLHCSDKTRTDVAFNLNGVDGIGAVGGTTYTFGGGGTGDVASMTFRGGILTAVTTVP